MFRSTTANRNCGYLKNLLKQHSFTGELDKITDFHTYFLNISASKLKELVIKSTFDNHLKNENGLLMTSSFVVKNNDEVIFEATIVEDNLIGMPKYNLIQLLKELDTSTELKLEIGLMNLYYGDIL